MRMTGLFVRLRGAGALSYALVTPAVQHTVNVHFVSYTCGGPNCWCTV